MRWIVSVVIVLVVLIVIVLIYASTMNMAAAAPGGMETAVATQLKYAHVGGKDDRNPTADTPDTVKEGAEHFQHHCQICHGLDGQNTGVPFANKMAPPVADLASARVQHYTDGQLKWIIDNGIRFTGMPGWKGVLSDEEAWNVVRYIRHLPAKGSLGDPAVFKEAEEEHEHGEGAEHQHGAADEHHHGAAEAPTPHKH